MDVTPSPGQGRDQGGKETRKAGNKDKATVPCCICLKPLDSSQIHAVVAHFASHQCPLENVDGIGNFHTYLQLWHDACYEGQPFCVYVPENRLDGSNSMDARIRATSNGGRLHGSSAGSTPTPMALAASSNASPTRHSPSTADHGHDIASILAIQHRDRTDTNFSAPCVFCPAVITPSRAALFNHMLEQHHFNMGHPDNLVFLDDLIAQLRRELDQLRCIYCHKTFKSQAVLRLHMRKKKHFKIDDQDTSYDKYYVTNYKDENRGNALPVDSTATTATSTPARTTLALDSPQVSPHGEPGQVTEAADSADADDADWGTWTEEVNDGDVQCLFCPRIFQFVPLCLTHCSKDHAFDFVTLRHQRKLSFYASVQIINYLRYRVSRWQCVACDYVAPLVGSEHGMGELYQHMADEKHCKLPEFTYVDAQGHERPVWDAQQYLFPIVANDPLLCGFDPDLDDDDDDDDNDNAE